MSFYQIINARLNKRAHYRRTRDAIRNMPMSVAHDLDIDPLQADRIARAAVYGG